MASSTSFLIISKNRNPRLPQTCCRAQLWADLTIHRGASNSATQEVATALLCCCGSPAARARTLQAWALTPGSSPTRSGCRGACAQGPSCNLHSRDIPLWRQGREGRGTTHLGRLSMCSPAQCSLQPPQGTRQLQTALGQGEEAPSHHGRVGEAEVSSQTHPNLDNTHQSRGHTGAHRGRGGAGRRGPGPRAHWSFAGRRGRPVLGSASHWHPAGSPPAG